MFGLQENLPPLEEIRRVSRKNSDLFAKSKGISYIEALLDVAMLRTAVIVQEITEMFTYPPLELATLRSAGSLYSLELFQRTWKPRNLLGAMYLQF